MHELGLTMSMLKIVNDAAEKNGAHRISGIRIRIGAFSGVVPELIEECFGPASRGTAAEGAELHFEQVPVTVKCGDCGRTGNIGEHHYSCPFCGSENIRIVTGREFYIESIEVKDSISRGCSR
jgi:hydrogenase nickel incorporation protein HypA/HybF